MQFLLIGLSAFMVILHFYSNIVSHCLAERRRWLNQNGNRNTICSILNARRTSHGNHFILEFQLARGGKDWNLQQMGWWRWNPTTTKSTRNMQCIELAISFAMSMTTNKYMLLTHKKEKKNYSCRVLHWNSWARVFVLMFTSIAVVREEATVIITCFGRSWNECLIETHFIVRYLRTTREASQLENVCGAKRRSQYRGCWMLSFSFIFMCECGRAKDANDIRANLERMNVSTF